MEKLPAVLGPTASGKTALGIALAKQLSGEIISCDSMQIYQGLSIGTAKPSQEELREAPHHLIGFCPIEKSFSVSDYVTLAEKTEKEIRARGKLPILVGGTGLYARAFLRGVSFEAQGKDEKLRSALQEEARRRGIAPLYERLQKIDPQAAEKIHPHNEKRVLRALEFFEATGMLFSKQEERSKQAPPKYDYRVLCLCFRDRQTLYRRIDSRVDEMMERGLLREAQDFFETVSGSREKYTAAQAIGYKELFPYFLGEISLSQAVENIKKESRRYAKRQITWFSREENRLELYVDDFSSGEELAHFARQLLEQDGFLEGEGKGDRLEQ